MSKRSLKILAIISLIALLLFTGCSVVGGVSSCFGDCLGCAFDSLGYGTDCLIYLEPFYCTISICGIEEHKCNKGVDNCYEGCLVTPAFICANCSRNDCADCTARDDEDIEKICSGEVTNNSYYDLHISEYHGNYTMMIFDIDVVLSETKNASCDGDYQRNTFEIRVYNNGKHTIKDAYIVFTYQETETKAYVGDIKAGGKGTFEMYTYTRDGEPFASNFDGADFTLYGEVAD